MLTVCFSFLICFFQILGRTSRLLSIWEDAQLQVWPQPWVFNPYVITWAICIAYSFIPKMVLAMALVLGRIKVYLTNA